MPMTLRDIEDFDRKDMLRIEHIHWAITHEVRELKQWNNALTLLTSYLAPVIIASEKAAAATAAATDDIDTETAAGTENTAKPTSHSTTTDGPAGGGNASTTTSKFSEFVEDETTGQYTKQLTEQDVRLIQWSIAALVRYAPTPSEANVVYMFYLQRQPPVRNDETIDNCLISLIYQYAQVKDDPELRAKGIDLIKVALERGVGLPSYKSRTSVKNQSYRPQRETILASVSKPILIQQGLQITADGRALEARRPGGQQQHQQQGGGRSYGQQKQQHGSQPPQKGPNGFPAGGQRQGQNQGQAQGQAMGGRKSGRPTVAGSSSPQPQPQSPQPQQQAPQQTQTQTQGKAKPRHRKQDSPRLANEDTQDSNSTRTTPTPTTPRQDVPMDQYDYYTSASRSFSGTERVKSGSRPAFGGVGGSSNGGKLRTIAFVPASNNPMLKTDHPAPDTEKGKEDYVTSGLTERVENLRLDQASDE